MQEEVIRATLDDEIDDKDMKDYSEDEKVEIYDSIKGQLE